jgi:hypothetical protein
VTVVLVDLAELERVVEQAVSRAVGAPKVTAGWLDTETAAAYLGLTVPSLRSMRQRGEGPPATTFPNGRVRWSVSDLDAWARSAREAG